MNILDLQIGQKFGRLTVVGPRTLIGKTANRRHSFFPCRCDCGKEKLAQGASLVGGSTKSCGCLKKESGRNSATHGMTDSPEWKTRASMMARCTNPKNPSWPSYGGRGITVCARWQESFENFYADMGRRPAGTSLDRIDVNGNYEPGNCRWADVKTQAGNKRSANKVQAQSDVMIKRVIAIAVGARADGRLLMAEGKYKEAAEVLMAAILTFLPWEED